MLKVDIHMNAGTIWMLLSEKGMLPIKEIAKITGYTEHLVLLALGWLFKENKISFFDQDGTFYADVTYSVEYYY